MSLREQSDVGIEEENSRVHLGGSPGGCYWVIFTKAQTEFEDKTCSTAKPSLSDSKLNLVPLHFSVPPRTSLPQVLGPLQCTTSQATTSSQKPKCHF